MEQLVKFQVSDANRWQPEPSSVDVIWIMESSEHFQDKPGFYYQRWMVEAGLEVAAAEDITSHVAPTWSHCSRIGENPFVRFFIHFTGKPTRRFVRSFPLMKQA